MKKILILLLFVSIKGFCSNVTTGSGSGAISYTSQGALVGGDTLKITSGTYSSFSTISNISGSPNAWITIIPLTNPTGHTVLFTAGIRFQNCKYVQVLYMSSSTSSVGINLDGDGANGGVITGISNFRVQYWSATGHTTYFVKNSNAVIYDWIDTTKLASYKVVFDSITLSGCGLPWQGAFGAVGQSGGPRDVQLNDTMSRWKIGDMTTNEGFAGIWFRCSLSFINQFQTTYLGYTGDVGLFSFGGGGHGFSGTIHDCRIIGPRGAWIGRINAYALNGSTTDSCLFYNIEKVGASTFGGLYIQVNSSDLITTHTTNCNVAVYNVSMGNCPTLNTYWNFVVSYGNGLAMLRMKNLLGFNNQFTAKTPGPYQFEGGTGPTGFDTANNVYAASATVLKLDSTGTWPTWGPLATSFIIGRGSSTPFNSTSQFDLALNPWAVVPSIGPYEYVTSISCGACRYGRKYSRNLP